MGLSRKVPSSPDDFQRHTQHLLNEITALKRRVAKLEDGRGMRPTDWIYVGSYPGSSDPYLASTDWATYVTPDSPNWQGTAFPLDPANSPVRFRVMMDREITPEFEGGFYCALNQVAWYMPEGYYRTDVGYTKYLIPMQDPFGDELPAATIKVQGADGAVVRLG